MKRAMRLAFQGCLSSISYSENNIEISTMIQNILHLFILHLPEPKMVLKHSRPFTPSPCTLEMWED